jgi:peptidoglycan hydrolase-like amidase
MGVKYSTLQTDAGFTSPNFNVDDTGALVLTSINVEEIKLGGDVIFTTAGAGTTGLVPSIVDSNLQTLGTLSSLTVVGATSLSGGSISITSTTTGSMNNVSIGSTVAASGTFTTLSATTLSATTLSATGNVTFNSLNQQVILSPTGTGSITINPTTIGTIDNVNIGSTTPAAGTFETLELTQEATTINQVPTKGYVDKRATALSIALGT